MRGTMWASSNKKRDDVGIVPYGSHLINKARFAEIKKRPAETGGQLRDFLTARPAKTQNVKLVANAFGMI